MLTLDGAVCSYATVTESGARQPLLTCRTCAMANLCPHCAERCHEGHHVTVTRPIVRQGYCMCGAGASCAAMSASASASASAAVSVSVSAAQRFPTAHAEAEDLVVFATQALLTSEAVSGISRLLYEGSDDRGTVAVEQLQHLWAAAGWRLFTSAEASAAAAAAAAVALPPLRSMIRALLASPFLFVSKAGSLRARVAARHPRAADVLACAAPHVAALLAHGGQHHGDVVAQGRILGSLPLDAVVHPALLLLYGVSALLERRQQPQQQQQRQGAGGGGAQWDDALLHSVWAAYKRGSAAGLLNDAQEDGDASAPAKRRRLDGTAAVSLPVPQAAESATTVTALTTVADVTAAARVLHASTEPLAMHVVVRVTPGGAGGAAVTHLTPTQLLLATSTTAYVITLQADADIDSTTAAAAIAPDTDAGAGASAAASRLVEPLAALLADPSRLKLMHNGAAGIMALRSIGLSVVNLVDTYICLDELVLDAVGAVSAGSLGGGVPTAAAPAPASATGNCAALSYTAAIAPLLRQEGTSRVTAWEDLRAVMSQCFPFTTASTATAEGGAGAGVAPEPRALAMHVSQLPALYQGLKAVFEEGSAASHPVAVALHSLLQPTLTAVATTAAAAEATADRSSSKRIALARALLRSHLTCLRVPPFDAFHAAAHVAAAMEVQALLPRHARTTGAAAARGGGGGGAGGGVDR